MRKVLLFVIALAVAAPATAIPIVPDNLDAVVLGNQVASTADLFGTASPPPLAMGLLDSRVFFDGAVYTYINTVLPFVNDASHLNTAFTANGFTGAMGYSFLDSFAAGGPGGSLDFLTAEVNGRLHWLALDRGIGEDWDAGEAIRFYFRSTAPPRLGDYNLLNSEAGTAQGFAPVPEPGTLTLLGTGLYGLYLARKRRKGQMVS